MTITGVDRAGVSPACTRTGPQPTSASAPLYGVSVKVLVKNRICEAQKREILHNKKSSDAAPAMLNAVATHQVHDGHNERPETRGKNTVGQVSHHQPGAYHRGEQPLSPREDILHLITSINICAANLQAVGQTDLAVLAPVERQAEHVRRVLGGAVGLRPISVLHVLHAEGRAAGVTGGGPHNPGRAAGRVTQQRLQLPDLGRRQKDISSAARLEL